MKKDVLWLATPFTAVVVLFLTAATVSLVMEQRIDADVTDIQSNALPSARFLSRARSKLTHLETDLAGLGAVPPGGRDGAIEEIHKVRMELQDELHAYSQTPWYAGEHELYDGTVVPTLTLLDRHLQDVSDGKDWQVATQRAVADVAEVDRYVSELLNLNHEQANAAAERVLVKREELRLTAILLNAGALALAAVLGVLAIRGARRLRAVTDQHAELQESRAQELEVFADRVAHDILSPLAGVSFLLGSIDREAPEVERLTGRARAALDRSRRLVKAVLDFSRSGGRPNLQGRANARTVVQTVVNDLSLRTDEVDIEVEAIDDGDVRCEDAVLSLVLTNLLENAVKYTKECEVRRVMVRTRRASAGHKLRFEVEDTGPGVPAGMERIIFEPYRRAPGSLQPGLGLGLATVHRFVTRHGGTLGVFPTAAGSVFWFELPVAEEELTPTSDPRAVRSGAPLH